MPGSMKQYYTIFSYFFFLNILDGGGGGVGVHACHTMCVEVREQFFYYVDSRDVFGSPGLVAGSVFHLQAFHF